MKIDHEVLSYLVTGGIVLGVAGPIVALLVYYIKDIKKLHEVRREKKPEPPLTKKPEQLVYHD